ncbi:MAG: Type II site-specific deoxyribonuclease, partial [Parcubacteria group bacterium GW2011_GWA2_40_8]
MEKRFYQRIKAIIQTFNGVKHNKITLFFSITAVLLLLAVVFFYYKQDDQSQSSVLPTANEEQVPSPETQPASPPKEVNITELAEKIVEELLKPICSRNELDCMVQATADKVKTEWGITLRVDKSSRRFDFAIRHDNNLCLIETNYYGGGGSKLKATAGEYKTLYDFLSADRHKFIWITDG